MGRVISALLMVAFAFAALVSWLDLNRIHGGSPWIALAVFIGVLVVGYPVIYWCCKHRWWELWRFTLIGTFGGGLCALPFVGGTFTPGFLMLIFMLAGALFGIFFWLGAIWRNDDLTCPKSFCLPCGVVYQVARNGIRRRNLI